MTTKIVWYKFLPISYNIYFLASVTIHLGQKDNILFDRYFFNYYLIYNFTIQSNTTFITAQQRDCAEKPNQKILLNWKKKQWLQAEQRQWLHTYRLAHQIKGTWRCFLIRFYISVPDAGSQTKCLISAWIEQSMVELWLQFDKSQWLAQPIQMWKMEFTTLFFFFFYQLEET